LYEGRGDCPQIGLDLCSSRSGLDVLVKRDGDGARIPMMATTIINSMSVKPRVLRVRFFTLIELIF